MITELQQAQLASLAAKYEGRWPALLYTNPTPGLPASRAQAATELVERGEVEYIGQLPSGTRYYMVCGKYRTATGAGRCDCQDRAPTDPQFGKLCKHRIAAMMVRSLGDTQQDQLTTLVQRAGAEPITLRVVRIFTDGEDAKTVTGYRVGVRGIWQALPVEEQFKIDNAALEATMRRTGQGMMRSPQRDRGYDYLYYLTPVKAEAGGDHDARVLRTVDPETLERRSERERLFGMAQVAFA